MSTADLAMTLVGLGAGFIVFLVICSIAITVLTIIAWWKIFKKAGQAGWKSIIPFYNLYILFKISWKPMWFWIWLVAAILTSILGAVSATAAVVIAGILAIFLIVVTLIQEFKLCKSFGWGVGMFILMILFNTIMVLVLGFGKAQYIGPSGEAQA